MRKDCILENVHLYLQGAAPMANVRVVGLAFGDLSLVIWVVTS